MLIKLTDIKAVSFDGDQTLWDLDKAMRFALQKCLEEIKKIESLTTTGLSVERMIAIRDKLAEELKGKVFNLGEIRRLAFQQMLREAGIDDENLADHLTQLYFQYRFEKTQLFADALPTLKTLQKKYSLGLLSNGNTWPGRLGIEKNFQFIIFSKNYKIEKPDPRIFYIAMEKAKCRQEELLHVGDSLTDDIAGATNAGVKSIWLNRYHKKNLTAIKPDFEIKSLSELLEIL